MKSALYASKLALQAAGWEEIDAVITGTGVGCLNDSERFVETLLEDELQLLNPTPFIQSTHNMPAATIALTLKCKGYNMTYVNGPTSFESALMDTMLYLSEHPNQSVLLGGMDEIGPRTYEFWKAAGYLNTQSPQIPTRLGKGEVASEGCTMFAVSSRPGQDTPARIDAVSFALSTENTESFIIDFLNDNQLETSHIDLLILGNNDDQLYDETYHQVAEKLFSEIPHVGYKHILGEYDTVAASSVAIAASILKNQAIPTILKLNDGRDAAKLERILIYNQRRNSHHSLILVSNHAD